MTTKLFTAETDNAATSAGVDVVHVTGTLYAFGTFDSATVKLQASPDGGSTWLDVTDASFTDAGMLRLNFAATQIRADISGGGADTISFWIL